MKLYAQYRKIRNALCISIIAKTAQNSRISSQRFPRAFNSQFWAVGNANIIILYTIRRVSALLLLFPLCVSIRANAACLRLLVSALCRRACLCQTQWCLRSLRLWLRDVIVGVWWVPCPYQHWCGSYIRAILTGNARDEGNVLFAHKPIIFYVMCSSYYVFWEQNPEKVAISRGNLPKINRYPRLIDMFFYLCIG